MARYLLTYYRSRPNGARDFSSTGVELSRVPPHRHLIKTRAAYPFIQGIDGDMDVCHVIKSMLEGGANDVSFRYHPTPHHPYVPHPYSVPPHK